MVSWRRQIRDNRDDGKREADVFIEEGGGERGNSRPHWRHWMAAALGIGGIGRWQDKVC